ncbi:unnamed protein product [Peronospora belbahrii]|uniref:Uncharacterized protein n=1 Tax=Peronospora belbahrii TaxID=622444 RepID=A0AAU9LCF0_9STRA|nr:unnamed protein product [Peronospora belbahrii]CAH0522479.1 unnamed protein product [Peronospora belbahrii]
MARDSVPPRLRLRPVLCFAMPRNESGISMVCNHDYKQQHCGPQVMFARIGSYWIARQRFARSAKLRTRNLSTSLTRRNFKAGGQEFSDD